MQNFESKGVAGWGAQIEFAGQSTRAGVTCEMQASASVFHVVGGTLVEGIGVQLPPDATEAPAAKAALVPSKVGHCERMLTPVQAPGVKMTSLQWVAELHGVTPAVLT